MHHIDLCSGIGGFALGFRWAGLSKPVLFCDIEPWSRKILRKHWPDVPILEDVKELANDPDGLIPDTDPRRTIITAGYPCQPFSLAGERRGSEDDRHIWPYILSIIQTKRPAWTVFENVYGHVSMGLDEVLSDLEGQSYAARPFIVPACATDAPHRRDRVWIIARNVGDTNSRERTGNNGGRPKQEESGTGFKTGCKDVAHANGTRPQRHMEQQAKQADAFIGCSKNVADANGERGRRGNPERQDAETAWQSSRGPRNNPRGVETWNPEPSVGRVANGIPSRVDRLRGLGNAIVPQIAQRIGQVIKQCEEMT